MTSFPLFTSIKPPTDAGELSYLRECLDSWRAAGFDPVSVSGPRETKMLRQLELPVDLHVTVADGKPRIGAILAAIRGRGDRFAGIINSDCKLIPYPDLAANLSDSLADRAALAWRIDIGDGEPSAEPHGLDGFFFDSKFAPSDDSGFTIGVAFWDTWFPVALAAAGAEVGKLDVPLITHRRHPIAWDRAAWLAGAQSGWTAFRTWRRDLPAFEGIPAAWWSREILNTGQLTRLGVDIITPWICKQRTDITILPPALRGIEMVLRLGGNAMLTGVLAVERAAEIENSTSWKITAPLRKAGLAMREMVGTIANLKNHERLRSAD